MAGAAAPVYVAAMLRLWLSLAVVLSLVCPAADAAPHRKRPAKLWHGYGFLPGYRQPLNDSVPLFHQKPADLRRARHARRPWYIDPTPGYYRWSDGEYSYFGRPGFYRGRYNGGSFGPCWTQTPIGPVWNCGR